MRLWLWLLAAWWCNSCPIEYPIEPKLKRNQETNRPFESTSTYNPALDLLPLLVFTTFAADMSAI